MEDKEEIIRETIISQMKELERFPTYFEVRKCLGDKGSFSTISKYYKIIREELKPPRPATPDPAHEEESVPGSLIAAIISSVKSEWSRYSKENEAAMKLQVDAISHQVRAEVETLRNELIARDDIISFLESECEDFNLAHQSALNQLSDVRKQVTSLEAQLIHAKVATAQTRCGNKKTPRKKHVKKTNKRSIRNGGTSRAK